ncbi:signal peptidase II [Candidatus Neptunochlamydia vexilliferae]|uniref:signal peptidase II n=1 Tax=Candidatus Neptunichlamydia vexilliferae TaxID=1651774 RepID=UPI001890D983|nr:signal peptidase II [Candidatus Neptunochlamydia vexilliferae]
MRRLLLFSAVALFLFDASTKYWIVENLPLFGTIPVFQNFFGVDFSISHARNLGGAWSLFSSYPIALLLVRVGIILALAAYVFFFNKERKREIPFMLILTGALGNIIDFFLYGSVVDMLHFVLWGYSYPVFNLADTFIFLGVATLIIQGITEKLNKRKRHET